MKGMDMGDRASIKLEYGEHPPLYLYVHWLGERVPTIVAKALEGAEGRWEDEPYLARVIASHLFEAAGIFDSTGAGLAPYEIEDTYLVIDFETATITAPDAGDGSSRWGYLSPNRTYTYQEFIDTTKKGASK